jgi:hypothetical protein
VPSGNEPLDRPCEPPSSFLRVTPPGSKGSLIIGFGYAVTVCGHGGLMTTSFE